MGLCGRFQRYGYEWELHRYGRNGLVVLALEGLYLWRRCSGWCFALGEIPKQNRRPRCLCTINICKYPIQAAASP